MANIDLLLSLLRFVALVAPALALLMQVYDRRDPEFAGGFRILQLSFTLLIFGGIIIGFQLISKFESIVTIGGVVIIFGALLLVGIAIWWQTLSLDISPSLDSRGDIFNIFKKMVSSFDIYQSME